MMTAVQPQRARTRRRARVLLWALGLVVTALVTVGVAEPVAAADAPSHPTDVVATPISATEASVTFTPGDDGGSPVVTFRVECQSSDGGAFSETEGTSSPIVVGSLTEGAIYTCHVIAVNAIGTSYGGFSNTFVQSMNPAVPDRPTDVVVTVLSPTSVSVDFTPGAPGGAPIKNYWAQCGSTTGGDARATWSTTVPVTVPKLSPGHTYRCKVKARNAFGYSRFSAFSETVDLPAARPGRPVDVTAETSSSSSATLSFSPPVSDGGAPIISYSARCESSTGGITRFRREEASPMEVVKLSPGHTYRCRVKATNEVGTGRYSTYSAPFTLPT